jgi:hypothetical protein
MSNVRFLTITLPLVLVLALVVLILPSYASSIYVSVIQPLALLAGSFFAFYASSLYRKELKTAFIFLGAFLLIYMLAIILLLSSHPVILPYLESHLTKGNILLIANIIQLINYLMLVLFCVYLLRVIDIRRLNRNGWIVFGLTFVISVFVAVYPEWDLFKGLIGSEFSLVVYAIIRLIDAALIIVLMPVVWLYVQYLKSRKQQSMTFTIVIIGIVSATLLDYLFEAILHGFPSLLAPDSKMVNSVPEAIFVFGYLIIAIGLYAHRRQDQWGYKAVDKAMSGEVELGEKNDGQSN